MSSLAGKITLLFALAVAAVTSLVAAPRFEPQIEVKGQVIDIRVAKMGEEAFPQYKRHRFGQSLPASVDGMSYAVSLKEYRGPEAVRATQSCKLLLAVSGATLDPAVWRPTGERFNINKDRFNFYEANYTTPNEWMELPKGALTVMLFARNLRVEGTAELPGTVVARIKKLRDGHITNPNIIICKDGSYLAGCTNANQKRGTELYRSTDRGATWQLWSQGFYPINFFTLFEWQDALYMMGTWTPGGSVIICKSTDGGRTFTFPEDEYSRGVLIADRSHSAPMPMVVHNGRIWRSMETNLKDEPRRTFVISADVNADLMKASSWKSTQELSFDPTWPTQAGGTTFSQWIEGCLVKTREGGLVNVLRVDEIAVGRTAAIVTVESHRKLRFDPATDIIEMPGGGKKFTIRYDEQSDRYWALVAVADPASMKMTHGGIYQKGLHAGVTRNTLTLISSPDLRNWREERVVIKSDNPFFDGFQYVDWQFDGDDIVCVIRTAMEEERGLPTRQHDANFLLFKRVEKFREAGETTFVKSLHKE